LLKSIPAYDIQQGMLLGEAVAINLLRDQAHLYNELQREQDYGLIVHRRSVAERRGGQRRIWARTFAGSSKGRPRFADKVR